MKRLLTTIVFLFALCGTAWAQSHFYLAQYVWSVDLDGGSAWRAPGRPFGALDLRNLAQMGKPVLAEGHGIFVYPATQIIAGSYYLGDSLDRTLSPLDSTTVQTMLGLPDTPTGTLRQFLWDMFGAKYSDPNGIRGPPPLRPTRNLRLELFIGGLSRAEQFDINTHPLRHKVIAALQKDYREIRQASLGFSAGAKARENYLRVLDDWQLKYKTSYKVFIPADMPDEGIRPRATVISDNFNRADESLDAGPWVEVQGNWSVSGNEVIKSATVTSEYARHTTALSSDDHKAKVTATGYDGGTNGRVGVAVRFSTDAAPNYDLYKVVARSNGLFILAKVVNGVATNLASPAITTSAPDDIELEANGSTLISRFNGSDITNTTDTALTANLQVGITARNANTDKLDDFSAEDLAAVTIPPLRSLMGVGQ